MRIAAGILMIIGGTIMFSFVVLLTTYGIFHGMYIPSWVTLVTFTLPFIVALFIIVGGILALKRKYWGICLAASILQLATLSLLGILSIIFVCIRKREWE